MGPGRTLEELLDERQTTEREAAVISANLARYLGSIHSGGGAYLGLTPRVVIVDEALNVHLRARTGVEEAAGDLAHRAPEQLLGEDGDWRSDCFAVGTLFYRLYTGRDAFWGRDEAELRQAVLEHDPEEITVLEGTLPWEVESILRNSLAKERESRYGSSFDLVRDLDSLCRRLVSQAPAAGGVPGAATGVGGTAGSAEPAEPGGVPDPTADAAAGTSLASADRIRAARRSAPRGSVDGLRNRLGDYRAERAREEVPSWGRVLALPLATLLLIAVGMLLYFGLRS